MKGVVYEGPGKLALREVPDVSPAPGEVKLRIKGCGICGSDVHGYLGLTGRRTEPMIMGHEFAGEVVELGEGVKDRKIGDRVAVYPVVFCEHCEMCKKGDVHLCLNKISYGVFSWNGAFTEHLCAPEKCCFPIADQVPTAVGTLMEPLAVAYRGVEHAGDLSGKRVLIVGAGTIGLLALACVKRKGAKQIIVSDLSDQRLAVARSMGADLTVNPRDQDLKEAILAQTGGLGVEVAVEAVGVAPTVQQAMSALAFGGTAVWIGNSKLMIEINMQEIVTRELKVFGSYLYSYDEFGRVAGLLNNGELNLEPLISREIPLEEAPDYFYKLAHDPGDLIKVVVVDR